MAGTHQCRVSLARHAYAFSHA